MRAIIKVVIRVLALVMFFRLLSMIINDVTSIIYYSDSYSMPLENIIYLAIAFFLGIAVILFIWIKADWFVRVLAGNIDDNALVVHTDNADLFHAAVRIIGLCFLIATVPQLFGLIAHQISLGNLESVYTDSSLLLRDWVNIVFTLIISIWFATGLKGIYKVKTVVKNIHERGDLFDEDIPEEDQ